MTHENVIDLITIQKPLPEERLDIYWVFEIMETDLGSIINSQQGLSEQHIQFFTYQILRGMKYVHSAGILHRDLKPKNLLVNGNCDLKIWDFGLSRTNIPLMVKSGAMTDYISTRWYRAPELLWGAETYNEAVDMWSIGWILAELLLRQPLLPGDDTKNQLELIVDCLGQPDISFLQGYNEGRMQNIFSRLKNQNKEGKLDEIFNKRDPDAIDLLKKMLIYDPDKRITIDEALSHSFIGDLHCSEDEPMTIPVTAFDFDFEMYDLNIEEQKELILDEISLYFSKKAQKKYIKGKKKHPNGMLYLKYGAYEGFVMPEVKEKKKKSKKKEKGEEVKEEVKEEAEEGNK